jgi:hypothetical protein
VIFTFMGDTRQEPAGYDAQIVSVPDACYFGDPADRVLIAGVVREVLRRVNDTVLRNMRRQLHHVAWTVTREPEQVSTLGLLHDCPECREGVSRALGFLQDHPGAEVAVGQFFWA